jgi:Mg-chelatase subunit ChlD
MNPDAPKTPREELELRLTALLLGELPDEEAAAWRAAIATNPELAKLHDRLEKTVGLVREATAKVTEPASDQTAPLQLSDERREKLLAHFKTVKPKEFVPEKRKRKLRLVELAAAVTVLGLLAAITLPMVQTAKMKSTFSTALPRDRDESATELLRLPVGGQPEATDAIAPQSRSVSEAGLFNKSGTTDTRPTSPHFTEIALPTVVEPESLGAPEVATISGRQNLRRDSLNLDVRGESEGKQGITTWSADQEQRRMFVERYGVPQREKQATVPAATPESDFSDYLTDAQRRLADLQATTESDTKIVESRVQVSGQPDSFYSDLNQTPAATPLPVGGVAIAANGVEQLAFAGRGISPTTGLPVEAALPADDFSRDGAALGQTLSVTRADPAQTRSYGIEPASRESGARFGGVGAGGAGGAFSVGGVPAGPQNAPGQAVAGDVLDGFVVTPTPALQPAKPQETVPPIVALKTESDGDKTPVLSESPAVGKLFQSDQQLLANRGRQQSMDETTLGWETPRPKAGEDFTGSAVTRYRSEQAEASGLRADAGVALAEESLRRKSSAIILPFVETAGKIPSDSTVEQLALARKDKVEAATQVQDGRILLEAGKLNEAEVTLGEAIKADPNNAAAFYYQSLIKERRDAETERLLEQDSKKDIVEVAEASERPVSRESLPVPNPHLNTNLIYTSGGRGAIVKKLDRIRFDQVTFEGVGLPEVLLALSDEAKKRDPEKKGINLLINPETPASGSAPTVVDPTTGLPVPSAPVPSVDINTVAVNLNAKGGEVRLADVLNAIVEGADQPLKYSIEDYAVVFSRADTPGASEREFLTRTYKIDPTKLKQGLESAGALFVTRTNSAEEFKNGIQIFFTTLGVDLDPTKGKTISWNYPTGTLLVRAAPKELEVIESAIHTLAATAALEQDVTPIRKPATNAPIPQPEIQTSENAFSTFSLNVSDVSFKLAAASLEKGQMPDPASIRTEEFINAFDYRDPEPQWDSASSLSGQTGETPVPLAFAWERARYPFAHNRDLLRFSLKTGAVGRQTGRAMNLVLLLDNSGSMERADRVHIIREALRVLAGQLQPQDKISVITFARTPRLWVDGAPGSDAGAVAMAASELTPQGGTNLEEAMNLAYQTALRHYLATGINRVVLLTDGAANLGNVEPESLKQKVETHRQQGIALDCFGVGWEGFNDDLLEVLSRNGDGRYGFLNSPEEAATEFARQLAGALQVAASDVKVQVEFNPARVTSYRQIGYAKHQLTKEQFRDNTVDAAEIAAQEAGNALYTAEVNPAGEGPLCVVRVRFKIPGTSDYREHEWAVPYNGSAVSLEQASPTMRLAASASAFSEWLVASPFAAEVMPDALLGYLSGVPKIYGADARPMKLEWMIRQAKSIEGK